MYFSNNSRFCSLLQQTRVFLHLGSFRKKWFHTRPRDGSKCSYIPGKTMFSGLGRGQHLGSFRTAFRAGRTLSANRTWAQNHQIQNHDFVSHGVVPSVPARMQSDSVGSSRIELVGWWQRRLKPKALDCRSGESSEGCWSSPRPSASAQDGTKAMPLGLSHSSVAQTPFDLTPMALFLPAPFCLLVSDF